MSSPSRIRTVLVTGASGKLGAPLCEHLLGEGYKILALRHRNPVGIDGVEEVEGDIADAALVQDLVARSDAIIHLATCKEDRDAVIDTSARGTFHLLEAAARTRKPRRVILASGDAINGIYFHPQPVPIDEELAPVAYPGYYPLSKVIEEAMVQQYFHQQGVPTVILRMSWIHAEDDILNHLTVAGDPFGIPVWNELMDDDQRAAYAPGRGRDAAVALRHPDGGPMRRHIVAVEDCIQAFHLALEQPGVEGETFLIAMTDPFDYTEAAEAVARQLGIDVIELVDPVGQDFFIDTSKARHMLGYRPEHDILSLIEKAVAFRAAKTPRRQRSGYKG